MGRRKGFLDLLCASGDVGLWSYSAQEPSVWADSNALALLAAYKAQTLDALLQALRPAKRSALCETLQRALAQQSDFACSVSMAAAASWACVAAGRRAQALPLASCCAWWSASACAWARAKKKSGCKMTACVCSAFSTRWRRPRSLCLNRTVSCATAEFFLRASAAMPRP